VQQTDQKYGYYLSMEFLQGRALLNAVENLKLEPEVKDALAKVRFRKLRNGWLESSAEKVYFSFERSNRSNTSSILWRQSNDLCEGLAVLPVAKKRARSKSRIKRRKRLCVCVCVPSRDLPIKSRIDNCRIKKRTRLSVYAS
jgi:hypothetical protein